MSQTIPFSAVMIEVPAPMNNVTYFLNPSKVLKGRAGSQPIVFCLGQEPFVRDGKPMVMRSKHFFATDPLPNTFCHEIIGVPWDSESPLLEAMQNNDAESLDRKSEVDGWRTAVVDEREDVHIDPRINEHANAVYQLASLLLQSKINGNGRLILPHKVETVHYVVGNSLDQYLQNDLLSLDRVLYRSAIN